MFVSPRPHYEPNTRPELLTWSAGRQIAGCQVWWQKQSTTGWWILFTNVGTAVIFSVLVFLTQIAPVRSSYYDGLRCEDHQREIVFQSTLHYTIINTQTQHPARPQHKTPMECQLSSLLSPHLLTWSRSLSKRRNKQFCICDVKPSPSQETLFVNIPCFHTAVKLPWESEVICSISVEMDPSPPQDYMFPHLLSDKSQRRCLCYQTADTNTVCKCLEFTSLGLKI